MYLVGDLRALRRIAGLRKEDKSDRKDQEGRNNEPLKRDHGVWLGHDSIGTVGVYVQVEASTTAGGSLRRSLKRGSWRNRRNSFSSPEAFRAEMVRPREILQHQKQLPLIPRQYGECKSIPVASNSVDNIRCSFSVSTFPSKHSSKYALLPPALRMP